MQGRLQQSCRRAVARWHSFQLKGGCSARPYAAPPRVLVEYYYTECCRKTGGGPFGSVLLRCFGSSSQGRVAAALHDATPLRDDYLLPDRRTTSGLGPVFNPRSVAVVGATDRGGSVGRTIVNNLILGKNTGGGKYKIFPVNPARKTVLDLPCYPSIMAIPEAVDMAVIVTPVKSCVSVMKECAAKGIKTAVVISAGFKEAGPEGVAYENELVRVARDGDIRVIGPNCLGVMNPNAGLNATFAATMALRGNVAFISQSGAMCTAVLDWSLREKVGFSAFVSIGSMADVNWGDLIDYLGGDPDTHSILIYMETVGNAAAFLSAAKEVGLRKPIVVIKAGRSEQAAKAAASHTGSLAGSHQSFEAAMRRVGVLTVDRIQDLFNCALLLGKQPRPMGPNLMIVTNAGGPGVLATDAAVGAGAAVPSIDRTTLERLDKILPPAWSHSNPVDVLGDADAELYAKTLEVCLADKNSDGVLVILSPQDVTDPTGTAKKLIEAVRAQLQKKKQLDKPVLAAWMGGDAVKEGFRLLNEAGIPTFSSPDEAAATFGKLWNQTKALDDLYGRNEESLSISSMSTSGAESVTATEDMDFITSECRARCYAILKKAAAEGRALLTEAESKVVLSTYGIPIVKTVVAGTADEAAEKAAKEIGGHLFAVKLNSETLTHKADVGGVKLNLKLDEIRGAFESIRESVTAMHGAQHFQGVTVQPMMRLDEGIELILGSTVDAQFGPLVMFGSGGTMVEVYKDTALAVPPLSPNLAEALMKQTKIFKALKGLPGKRFEGVNLIKLQEILARFSTMIVDLSSYVAECDINPLLATKNGFAALDARIALTKPGEGPPPLAVRPYPLDLVSHFTLKARKIVDVVLLFGDFRTGKSVTIRPVHSTDEEKIRVCQADYDRLLTLVVLDDAQEIIGIADLERPPSNHLHRECAFLSLVVRDDYQRKGLGSALMKKVAEVANREAISSIKAAVLTENAAFLKLAERHGWKCDQITDERGVKLCTLDV